MALPDAKTSAELFGAILKSVEGKAPPPSFLMSSGQRAGKSTFAQAMRDFLATPGYSSVEASAAGGHDAYMQSKFGKAPPASPFTITTEVNMPEDKDTGAKVDALVKEAVEQYAEAFQDHLTTFELSEPMKLTVRNGSDYKVKPFIGGEEFTPVRGYIGKKGKTLIVFKPVGTADFEEMEMEETVAKATFSGFGNYLKDSLGELLEKIDEAKAQAKAVEREADIRTKSEIYADQGFGSW